MNVNIRVNLIISIPTKSKPNYITIRRKKDAKNEKKIMHKMIRVGRKVIESD